MVPVLPRGEGGKCSSRRRIDGPDRFEHRLYWWWQVHWCVAKRSHLGRIRALILSCAGSGKAHSFTSRMRQRWPESTWQLIVDGQRSLLTYAHHIYAYHFGLLQGDRSASRNARPNRRHVAREPITLRIMQRVNSRNRGQQTIGAAQKWGGAARYSDIADSSGVHRNTISASEYLHNGRTRGLSDAVAYRSGDESGCHSALCSSIQPVTSPLSGRIGSSTVTPSVELPISGTS